MSRKATTPKVGRKAGGKATKSRPAPKVTTPVGKAADCDTIQTPVKAPLAPLPPTADLLSPSVPPCPPGQPSPGKP